MVHKRSEQQSLPETISMMLTAYMDRWGITQTELAGRLGIKQPSMSKLLNGSNMRLSSLQRIIEALDANLRLEIR